MSKDSVGGVCPHSHRLYIPASKILVGCRIVGGNPGRPGGAGESPEPKYLSVDTEHASPIPWDEFSLMHPISVGTISSCLYVSN